MVGGRVWHVGAGREGRLLLVRGTGSEAGDWLCVRVVPGDEPLACGDQVWWQGRWLYWTPGSGREEVPIARIGYAFAVPTEMRRLMNERSTATVQ